MFTLLHTVTLLLLQLITSISTQETICRRTLDLAFAIDSSNSLGQQRFAVMMNTLARAVDALEFAPDEVRVGASVYSTTTDVIPLQVIKEEFQRQILNLVYHDEGTNTDQGIREATRILQQSRRPDVPIAIMLVTDGESADKQAAAIARQEAINVGVDFWTVGVGPLADMEELTSLASSPDKAFYIETFDSVPDQLISLTREVCEEADLQPDLTAPPSNPLADLCNASPMYEGVRYVPYPEDCTKVLQCYLNEAGRYLIVTRTCPLGQYWDQKTFSCQPSWTVDCPYDPCKSCNLDPQSDPDLVVNEDGRATYSMADDAPCGAYWECIGGKSYPRCCPPLYSYQAGCGCKLTGQCWESCNINSTCADGIAPCYMYPDWTSASRYFETAIAGQVPTAYVCPYGGSFGVVSCECDYRVMDILRGISLSGCSAMYRSTTPIQCNTGLPAIMLQGVAEGSPLALRVLMDLTAPGFQVKLSTSGPDQVFLSVVGDPYGVHGTLATSSQRGQEGNATSFFLDATGQLDITLMYYQDVLTLSVTQDSVTHVALAAVPAVSICTNCQLYVTTQGAAGCVAQQVEVYTCEAALYNQMYFR